MSNNYDRITLKFKPLIIHILPSSHPTLQECVSNHVLCPFLLVVNVSPRLFFLKDVANTKTGLAVSKCFLHLNLTLKTDVRSVNHVWIQAYQIRDFVTNMSVCKCKI
jgi:hypothetical protein